MPDARTKGIITQANVRAAAVTRRWFKAAKDPQVGQITRNERIQLRRLICVEIATALGARDVTIADVP